MSAAKTQHAAPSQGGVMSTAKTPCLPSLTLLDQPALMEELTSSRATCDLASKHVSKKVCEWYLSWRPWQQRMLLCGLTDRCSRPQLETLATTLEPVFHRDFLTTVKQRYPSAPFKHMKKRQQEKERKAEQRRLAAGYNDRYHARFPDTMPRLQLADLDLFTSLLGRQDTELTDDTGHSVLPPVDEYAEQLSARVIVNALNVLRSDPGRLLVSSQTSVTSADSSGQNATPRDIGGLADDVLGNLTSSDDKNVPEECLDESDEKADHEDGQKTEAPESERRTEDPESESRERKLSVIREEGGAVGGASPPAGYQGSESAPESAPGTITDPLNDPKPTRSTKARSRPTPQVNLQDLPPLKLIQHRHRSAIGTGSDVATVDFFLGNDKVEKLGGFLQREMRRGPVRKLDVTLPLQNCYKHVKLCSDNKPYVKAHRHKLQVQFKRQLKQVWSWIQGWQDHERLSLLSDVTKLCTSQTIQYLCQCLTVRLRDRVDIDSLPDGLLTKVMEYLDYKDIVTCTQVSHRWRYVCNQDKLWQRKCRQLGRQHGLPNVNKIITKTRRKSKQIDWKLAYLEVMRIIEENKNTIPKPQRVHYEESTPEGMVRIDGKFYPVQAPSEASDGESEIHKRRMTVSEVLPVKRGTIFYLRDHEGLHLVSDDDDDSCILPSDEYSIFRDDDANDKKRSRRRQRAPSTYGSSFDVSGRTRYEPCRDHIPEEDGDKLSERSGMKPIKRKKRRQEEEPALDIRPELRQARDLLSANVPRRTLMWKDAHRPELKQKTAKFAGEVKSVQRVRKLQGHLDSVLCIAISKRRMISGSMDRSIRVWDLSTGRSIHKLYGHMGGVRCLYFDGSVLVSGSWDMQAMVWDLVKFDRLALLTGHRGSVSSVKFNDKYLVTASHDTTLRVYYAQTYTLHSVIRGHSDAITSLTLQGHLAVTASSDKTVRVTDMTSGELLRRFQLQDHITSLCLQNNLIITGNAQGQCHFLNKETGRLEAAIEVHKPGTAVNQVLFYKNRFFTCSNDSTIKEWDLVTMTCIRYLQGPRGLPIRDVRVDDRRIISCGDDGNIRIWDMVLPAGERASAAQDVVPSAVIKN